MKTTLVKHQDVEAVSKRFGELLYETKNNTLMINIQSDMV